MTDITFSIGYNVIRDQILDYVKEESTHEALARRLYLNYMKQKYVEMKVGEAKLQAQLDIIGVV